MCSGDPSAIPSAYARYLSEEIKDKYGDPYFVGVEYTGFTKTNIDENAKYSTLSSDGKKVYDTVFTFDISMSLKAGSDQANATLDLNADEEVSQ